jgi:hypothetical protein
MIDDIMAIFTTLGTIPNNEAFVQEAVPKAFDTLKKYHSNTAAIANNPSSTP